MDGNETRRSYTPNVTAQVRVPKTAELVAGRIRRSIVTGELRTGDSLPSEAHLITDFQVSRPTIREAIRILESEGLISVSRGARGRARWCSCGRSMAGRWTCDLARRSPPSI